MVKRYGPVMEDWLLKVYNLYRMNTFMYRDLPEDMHSISVLRKCEIGELLAHVKRVEGRGGFLWKWRITTKGNILCELKKQELQAAPLASA